MNDRPKTGGLPRTADDPQRLKRATTKGIIGRDSGRADVRLRNFSRPEQERA